MSGRTSEILLAAGFVVVLALALGLLQLTHGPGPAAGAPHGTQGPATSAQAPLTEDQAPHAPALAARERAPVSAIARGRVTMPVRQPELAPVSAPVSADRELKRDENGKLVPMIPVKELRAQLHLTAAPMKACIERSGQHPTGKATLSFTVAAKSGKLVIETTSVQDSDTLADYPELLECMHRTANVLVLDGYPVPELGTPIYIRRNVRLENGVLAEDSIFNFSYHP